jgi:hypothetical protein
MLWFLPFCAQGTRQVRLMKKLLVTIVLTTTLRSPGLAAETSSIIIYRRWTQPGNTRVDKRRNSCTPTCGAMGNTSSHGTATR